MKNSPQNSLPGFAVIGGSQAFRLLADGSRKKSLGERDTPFGKSRPIHLFEKEDASFLFLSRHGEEGYSIAAPFVNYRANIYALKDLGVRQIVAWSGPGAISKDYKIGQLVIIDDMLDETHRRKSTFYEHGGLGFIRQNPVFCPSVRRNLETALGELGIDFVSGGTYVCTEGPRLETPAEIRKYALCGADLVGMTLAPEVFLAKELEMCYAALCYVTNYAEGIKRAEFKPGVLFEGLSDEGELKTVEDTVARFPAIIEAMARLTSSQPDHARESERSREPELSPECKCSRSMQRYRDRGDIGSDWHEWVKP
jgi:5'-methylthioadenosine phosphorylase